MSNMSNYLENAIYNHVLRATAMPSPASVFIALSTADPLEDGTGLSEPVGNGYARLEVGGATGRSFTAPADGAGDNTEEWAFPQATAAWGTITHFAVMDAGAGGNQLLQGPLNVAKPITQNDVFKFPVGDLDAAFS